MTWILVKQDVKQHLVDKYIIYNVFGNYSTRHAIKKIRNAIEDEIKDSIKDAIRDTIQTGIRGAIRDGIRDAFQDNIWNAIRARLRKP